MPPAAPPSPPRFAVLAGVFAVGVAVLYALSTAVAPVYPEVHARQALLEAQANDIEAVTLGHSHSRAVLFDSLAPGAGFHLWRSSRDPFETRWAFEAKRDALPALKTVLVAVAPYAWDNTALPSAARDRRRELYALHPTAGRWATDIGLRAHALAAPIARGDHWKGVAYALLGRPLAVDVEPNGWIDDRPRATVRDAATLDSIAVLTAAAHAEVDALSQAARASFCNEAADALAALPALAGADVQVVFYTPPYWPPYLRRLDATATCDLRPVARHLSAQHAHVRYVDDSRHPAFVRDAGLFLDADHLNAVGAGRYSALLRDRLAGLP